MIDNTKEYLLCAAIRRLETRDCHKVAKIKDIYDIEIGLGHAEIMHRFEGEVSKKSWDQGFLTSKRRFVDRKEGLIIARECGQVDKIIGGVLTSEDLY